MTNFVIRVKDAKVQNGVVSKLTGNATLKTFVDLITNSDLDANPRTAKKSRVTEDISATLHETPELFQYMSKGILFAARSVTELERSRYKLEIEDAAKEGVLDGGHNTFTIGRYVLELTGYEKWDAVKSWSDLKEHWSNHVDEINSQRDSLPEVLIPIEIIYPAEGPQGIDDFESSILAISAARNNNAQLQETAKANKAGYYDEIKENIDPALLGSIEWKENDGGRIKAADIVSLALIPLSALPSDEYKVVKLIRDNPNTLFSSKGQCVRLYNDFMKKNEGVTQKVSEDRVVEIVDPKVKSALSLIKDIPRLYDAIYKRFPEAYNKTSPRFGGIECVKKFSQEKWKSDKKKYMRKPGLTKFYQQEMDWQYPDGYIYPLVVSLAELIEVKGDEVRWKVDPEKVIVEKLDAILSSGYQSMISGHGYDPAKVGKDKGTYNFASNMYRLAEHL